MKLPKFEEGWSTALLLFGAVVAAALTLVTTGWAEGLGVVPVAGVGGLVAGLLLGWSVFRGWMCHVAGLVYGLTWMGYILGRDLPGDLTWAQRIAELVGRLSDWLNQAVSGGKGYDTLIFVMLMSGLYWILGYNAAWNTYRRVRVWRAILPPGVVALFNVYYYGGFHGQTRYLVFYLFCALLYIARSHSLEQEGVWRRRRMAYDPDLHFSVLQVGAVMVLIVIVLAWALPGAEAWPSLTAVWHRVNDPWRTVQEEWQRLFSGLYGSPARPIVEPFGDSLTLGGPGNRRDAVVMDIAAPREGRYYWRGAAYTYYDGDQWDAAERERLLLARGRQPPGMVDYALRSAITQTVTSYVPGLHLLIGASQPVALARDAEASINLTGDAPLEFIRVFSLLPLDAGDEYVVMSSVSVADATSLREADADYPEWVRRRYLQLPGSLPERVRLLAEDLTAGADNSYDKAIALQQYLRVQITYDLDPPELPEGRDYVDFLLFDSRRDYCNGYATAMVVMARSLSIPARLASGYAQGEYDVERAVYRVRDLDAHSWVEVCFPGYGWIEFEPTAGQPPLIRPDRAAGQGAGEGVPPGAQGPDSRWGMDEGDRLPASDMDWALEGRISPLRRTWDALFWPLTVGLAILAVAAGGRWAVENWGFRGLSPVERAYARLVRFGRWMGRPIGTSDTPLEWARAFGELVPEAQEPITCIVDLYVRACFARGDRYALAAMAAWERARPVLWQGWLRGLGGVGGVGHWLRS